jgi:hypothetical protein
LVENDLVSRPGKKPASRAAEVENKSTSGACQTTVLISCLKLAARRPNLFWCRAFCVTSVDFESQPH